MGRRSHMCPVDRHEIDLMAPKKRKGNRSDESSSTFSRMGWPIYCSSQFSCFLSLPNMPVRSNERKKISQAPSTISMAQDPCSPHTHTRPLFPHGAPPVSLFILLPALVDGGRGVHLGKMRLNVIKPKVMNSATPFEAS